VPTARRKASEYGTLRGVLVEMERLWIEFGSEALDALALDPDASGSFETLPCLKILEIELLHRCILQNAARRIPIRNSA
jgi:hypothetical protein